MADIFRKRGDTYPIQFKLLDKETELAFILSQYTFIMTVDPDRNPETDVNNIFSLAGVLVDPSEGLLEFRPAEIDVDHIGRFWYDVEMTDNEGKVRTIIKAKFQLGQDITK